MWLKNKLYYQMVKKLDNNSKNYIHNVFYKFFVDGCFPAEWQHSVIIPIPKPGKDHSKSDNYRPMVVI